MIIDRIISAIAPQQCIACGVEGAVLCDECLLSAGENIPSRCAGCRAISVNYKTCKTCRSWMNAYAVYVATQYDGIYENLLREYKFHVKREASKPIATIMSGSLQSLPKDIIVCPLPTAPSRVRQRGFDHAKLLAKKLSTMIDRPYKDLLGRTSNVRQLGSSRSKRIEQMRHEFFLLKDQELKGKEILLVDDVMTTGASVSAASKTLKRAGVKRVYSAIFAQKM